LNEWWFIKKIKEKILKFLRKKRKGNTTILEHEEHSKCSTKGKDYSLQVSTITKADAQENNQIMHLKISEKQKQTKHKISNRKEIIQTKAEVN
jgi:hypothetical protein